jgi:hypothetical protein
LRAPINDNRGAFPGQDLGDGVIDAGGAAGDKRFFVLLLLVHMISYGLVVITIAHRPFSNIAHGMGRARERYLRQRYRSLAGMVGVHHH